VARECGGAEDDRERRASTPRRGGQPARATVTAGVGWNSVEKPTAGTLGETELRAARAPGPLPESAGRLAVDWCASRLDWCVSGLDWCASGWTGAPGEHPRPVDVRSRLPELGDSPAQVRTAAAAALTRRPARERRLLDRSRQATRQMTHGENADTGRELA